MQDSDKQNKPDQVDDNREDSSQASDNPSTDKSDDTKTDQQNEPSLSKASSDTSITSPDKASAAAENTSTKPIQPTAPKPGASHNASATSRSVPPTSSNKASGLLVGALLVLLMAMGGVGYWLWMNLQSFQDELVTLKNTQAQLKLTVNNHDQGVQQLSSGQTASVASLTELMVDNERQKKQMVYLSEQMASLTGVRRQDWEIARLEYLLRLASQRLQLDGDLEGAKSTLLAADVYLTTLDDPRLLPVRKQVAKDLLLLNQVERGDRAGTYLALDALIDYVPSLQPDKPQFEVKPVEIASADSMGFVDWVSKKLEGLVRITASEVKPKASWLSQDAKAQFNAMLTLRLLHAQQALMSEDQKVYDSALAQAKELVDTLYLGRKDTQSFIEQLSELQTRQITMADVDISGSHKVLKAYLEEAQRAIYEQVQRSMIQGKGEASSSGNKEEGN
ncbi:uroporphyrinogen-III C-methyltransferase [Litoribrevibacter euphylliae]|uniref:Uroporphyrinogen-III C-methyltransferase n=1 Tax=Litoribrevibacter euphylliae TaxID=1834034 RepID=A0ABV7HMG2_9GAMM